MKWADPTILQKNKSLDGTYTFDSTQLDLIVDQLSSIQQFHK